MSLIKKYYPKTGYPVLLILFITALAYSCKKDYTNLPPDVPEENKIEQARKWYEFIATGIPQNFGMFRNTRGDIYTQSVNEAGKKKRPVLPDWKSALESMKGDSTIIEVPVKSSGKNYFSSGKLAAEASDVRNKKSFTRLLYISSPRKTEAFYMNVIPDDGIDISSDRVTYQRKSSSFSGIIMYYSLNGKFMVAEKYKRGRVTAYSLKDKQTESPGGMQTMVADVQMCDYTIIWNWYQDCYTQGEIEWCDPVVIEIVSIIEFCPPPDAGGGGGTGPPPNNCEGVTVGPIVMSSKVNVVAPPGDDEPIDPNNPPGTPSDPPPYVPCPTPNVPEVPELLDTINHVDDPCMIAAIDLALGLNVNTKIKNMMSEAFIGINQPSLHFWAYPFTQDTGNDASTDFDPLDGSNFEIHIRFNLDRLGPASVEYQVATVYHEILHGYLYRNFPPVNNGGQLSIPNQHEYIIWNYIAVFINDMKTLFPNLSDTDAMGLAWEGLGDTSFYDAFVLESVRATIQDVNSRHRTGTSGEQCND